MDDDKSPAAFWMRAFHARQARDMAELDRVFKRHIEEESRTRSEDDLKQPNSAKLTASLTPAAVPISVCGASAIHCHFPSEPSRPRPAIISPPYTLSSATNNTAAVSWSTVRGTPPALSLPVGVLCVVYISVPVSVGHFFVQLPTHPSFASLAVLDQYMLSVYTQPGGAPEMPKPCNVGVLCAAPAYKGWFRALTLAYQDQDEMLVRFVDYGGFACLPRAYLRQIRTDFMSVPCQAIECHLANVQPADGSSHWSEKANQLFQQLCVSKFIHAKLVGFNKNTGIPCVELFVLDNNKKSVCVDQILLERGLAKPIETTSPLMS